MEVTSKTYKKQYCYTDTAGWNNCKCYLIKEKTGKCLEKLLPNSIKSIEEILLSMN
jgi:hypothetical protein